MEGPKEGVLPTCYGRRIQIDVGQYRIQVYHRKATYGGIVSYNVSTPVRFFGGGGGGCQLIVAETKAGEQLETYHKLGYPPVEAGGKGTFTPKTTARNLMKDLPSSRMIHGKG